MALGRSLISLTGLNKELLLRQLAANNFSTGAASDVQSDVRYGSYRSILGGYPHAVPHLPQEV